MRYVRYLRIKHTRRSGIGAGMKQEGYLYEFFNRLVYILPGFRLIPGKFCVTFLNIGSSRAKAKHLFKSIQDQRITRMYGTAMPLLLAEKMAERLAAIIHLQLFDLVKMV